MMQYAPKIQTKNGMVTPAYFYYTYRITLEENKNQKGRWYQPHIAYNNVDGKIVTVLDFPNGQAIWKRALGFKDTFKSGGVRAATQIEEDENSI